jgi:hypothetical protein
VRPSCSSSTLVTGQTGRKSLFSCGNTRLPDFFLVFFGGRGSSPAVTGPRKRHFVWWTSSTRGDHPHTRVARGRGPIISMRFGDLVFWEQKKIFLHYLRGLQTIWSGGDRQL